MNSLRTARDVIHTLQPKMNDFRSKRLRRLLSSDIEGGLFPSELSEALTEFECMLVWKQSADGVEIPEPQPGLDEHFDQSNQYVERVKGKLGQYLDKIKSKFNCDKRISWSHAKYRYEIEMPAELVEGNKKPDYFEFTSQKKDFQRFHTREVKKLVDELETAEDRLKEALVPFLGQLFGKFHERKTLWDSVVQLLAELDCLASLSIVSSTQLGPMCRPVFIPNEGPYSNSSLLDIKQLRHPCVVLNNQRAFVPNNILVQPGEVLLVTGPNMGGKSTLLRSSCIAVILAQLGCYVPAESMRMTMVDRVFTRIGASDRILEGKSTFYVEMEETKSILKSATFKSLAIVDELGRGTSTFDGYSIAHAVLNNLVNQVRCRSLFSTHYHMLLDDFRDRNGVQLYHMACRANEAKDEVMFLYRFEKGECPASFGLNVARMAGIPRSVIEIARRKAQDFSEKLNNLTSRIKMSR